MFLLRVVISSAIWLRNWQRSAAPRNKSGRGYLRQSMDSIKCIECGLVNFASAKECKRCHVKFHKPEEIANAVAEVSETAENNEVSTEPFENGQSQVPLAPLPEYFDAEPAPSPRSVSLFSIFLGLSILVFLYQLKVTFVFMNSSRYQLTTEQNGLGFYIPGVEPIMYAELFLKGAELVAALGVMVLLLKKSWAFLRWVRIYLLITALLQVAEIVAAIILRASFDEKFGKPTQLSELEVGVGLLVGAAFIMISLVWAAYFEKSERVRMVFIN